MPKRVFQNTFALVCCSTKNKEAISVRWSSCQQFHQETLQNVKFGTLQKGDWMTILDIKDAYFHLLLNINVIRLF